MSAFPYQQTGPFLLENENWGGLPSLECCVLPRNEALEMKKTSATESSTVVNNKRRKNTVCSSSKRQKKVDKKSLEEPPSGFIHVRARRGQATDSHSLAERWVLVLMEYLILLQVRREKISERMKTLQSLVPGCDQVSGKALVLDEIINYVQSLQNQVEFLSMRLASMNPLYFEFGMQIDELPCWTPMEAVPPSALGQKPVDVAGSVLSDSDSPCPKTLNPPLFDNGFFFSSMKYR